MFATIARISAGKGAQRVFAKTPLENRTLSKLPQALLQVDRPQPGTYFFSTSSVAKAHQPTHSGAARFPLFSREMFDVGVN